MRTHPLLKLLITLIVLVVDSVQAGCGDNSLPVPVSQDATSQLPFDRPHTFMGALSPQGGTITGATTGGGLIASNGKLGIDSTGFSTGNAVIWNGTIFTHGGGLTNAAGSNVIPVSLGAGSGFGSSGETDDGTTWTSSRNDVVTGRLSVSGQADFNSGSLYNAGFGSAGGSGQVYIVSGTINAEYASNATDHLDLNWFGYQGGATQFRDLNIRDGEGAIIATFTGSTKATTLNGSLTTTGAVVNKSTETVWGNWTGSGNVTLGDISARTITINGTTITNANVTVGGALTVSNGFTSTLNGNVTLGSGAATGIAFNGKATTALDMNTHLINNVVDPVSAQDAVTPHYLTLTGYTTASSLTTGRSVRATSATVLGTGAWTDDGTNAATNGNLTSIVGNTTVGNFRGQTIAPTLTGGATVGDWAPTGNGTARSVFVNCPSGTCTIDGLVGGADGREITIYNTGAGAINLPNNNPGATAANRWNNATGTQVLAANSGCSADYTYSTADNFWHLTGQICDQWLYDGASITTTHAANMRNTSVTGWVDSTGTMYAGGDASGLYLSNAVGGFPSLGFGFGTNAAFTGFINAIGYNEGTTQQRTLWIQDGQGSGVAHSVAQFDAATHNVIAPNGNIQSAARFIAAPASGTAPMFDWKQTGQTEWQLYQTGSTNGLQLWNSTAGADIASWDTSGNMQLTGYYSSNQESIFLARQVFTASGTYTPTSGTRKILLHECGAGGGGGGGKSGVAGGGAGGAYLEKWINPSATITGGAVTIGAAGTAGTIAPTAGGNGGDTTVVVQAITYTAKGGLGGLVGAGLMTAGVAGQSGSTAGDLNQQGNPGGAGIGTTSTSMISGTGGSSPFGSGGIGVKVSSAADVTGVNGQGACSGGGGGASGNTSAAGGTGTAGMIIIDEYR